MDSNKILSANILDLIFDNRNKEYGAYELRNTYPERITKALIITSGILLLFIAGTFLAKPSEESNPVYNSDEYFLTDIKPDERKAEIPKSEIKKQTVPVKTIISTPPEIVNRDVLDKSLTPNDELTKTKIGTENIEGMDEKGIAGEKSNKDSKDVDETPREESNGPISFGLQKEAKFNGNWENFLRRNLNANVPADNGAPTGNHTILIQFVVDIDGTVSDIKPITNLGYGMEQEAIRVMKKATKWEPAFQNGHHVKAFRRQPITFQVLGDE